MVSLTGQTGPLVTPSPVGHPSGEIVTEAVVVGSSSSPPHSPSLSTSTFQFCKLDSVPPGLPTSPVSLPQPGSYPHPGPPGPPGPQAQINGGLVQNLQEHLQHQQKVRMPLIICGEGGSPLQTMDKACPNIFNTCLCYLFSKLQR